jgi:hypothetical protein
MQCHPIYHIRNVPIYVRNLPSGDITVWHPVNDFTRLIVEAICRDHGYWHSVYNNWIIFSAFKHQVIAEITSAGEQYV